MLADMSETTASSEPPTGPVKTVAPPPPEPRRPSRLNVVAAWVGIVAGVVFIVAVVFGTGFMLGVHAGGGGSARHHEYSLQRVGPPGMFPMHRMPPFGGPGGPGGPGLQAPEAPGTPGAPTTTAPARP